MGFSGGLGLTPASLLPRYSLDQQSHISQGSKAHLAKVRGLEGFLGWCQVFSIYSSLMVVPREEGHEEKEAFSNRAG